MWRKVSLASALAVVAACADTEVRSASATRSAAVSPIAERGEGRARGARGARSHARAAPTASVAVTDDVDARLDARLDEEGARAGAWSGADARDVEDARLGVELDEEEEHDEALDAGEAGEWRERGEAGERRERGEAGERREAAEALPGGDLLDDDAPLPLEPIRPEGMVKGSIQRVRPGTLYFRDESGPRRVDGTPYDLGELNAGDAVEVPYRVVGERAWVWPARSAEERPPLEAYAVRGSVTGPVTEVDREGGLLGIGRLRLRAHPTDLEEIGLGQVLEVRFVEIAGRIWVHSVEPTWSRTAPHAASSRR